jgi:hypothetical protein
MIVLIATVIGSGIVITIASIGRAIFVTIAKIAWTGNGALIVVLRGTLDEIGTSWREDGNESVIMMADIDGERRVRF